MKQLISVVQIFNYQELAVENGVINALRESLSADPLCCVFVRTHSAVSVRALTVRPVFHKQMLTQDSCSSDISVLNDIHPVLCGNVVVFK